MKGSLAAVLLLAGPIAGQSEELRILTSMPPSLTDPFVALFAEAHSEVDVLVLNKHTASALGEVLRGNPRRFDLFWASAPEAFAFLADEGAFLGDGAACPAATAQGHVPFAVSSLGWTVLADDRLPVPGEWDDLLDPAYRGEIGMALPSRSGTTHMLVERFLQVRGWDEGWAWFLELSGNLSTLTSRSFGVVDGVRSGRFGVGLTIDFLARGEAPDLAFRYGAPLLLAPAQIGLLRGAGQPGLGCDFLATVVSPRGQELLLDPAIARIPSDAAICEAHADRVPPEVMDALRLSWQSYDAELAQARYWAVGTLFDVVIADLLSRRRGAWARLHGLEGRADPRALDAVRAQLVAVPVTEQEALNAALDAPPAGTTDIALAASQRAVRQLWSTRAEDALRRAEEALAALERDAPP